MQSKFYSLLAASLLSCGVISAQEVSYHGFHINASKEFIEWTDVETPLTEDIWNIGGYMTLQVLFQPEYNPIMVDNALTTITKTGTTVMGNPGKLVDYAAPIVSGTTELLASESLEAGKISGLLLQSEMGADGLAYVTCPSQCYVNGVMTNVDGGDIRVRFCTRNKENSRIGDSEKCYASDITGVYLTVSAPTSVEVSSHYTQANLTTTFSAEASDASTTDQADQLGKIQRTAIFPLGHTTVANTPEDLSYEGLATNAYNLFTYKRNGKDALGFPIRFVDIVFTGVKAGEKVGWTNYQGLHTGYTPVPYSSMSGIANVGVDADNNAPVEYFNLQGVRVDNPTTGLYIQRQGSKATKVLVK
jgi:hypothetical protein